MLESTALRQAIFKHALDLISLVLIWSTNGLSDSNILEEDTRDNYTFSKYYSISNINVGNSTSI